METLLLTKANNFFSFGPVADVLGWIMDLLFRFTNLFGIMNIGLCIILFTAVIKLLLLPLTIKQQKSSKLMAVMQPEMKMIQEKYKGKTDQQSMMMQNQEMKALYEKYGTSMTGGCPVSYTHLDVYKRQCEDRTVSFSAGYPALCSA